MRTETQNPTKFRTNFFEVSETGELMYNDGHGRSYHNVMALSQEPNGDIMVLVEQVHGMIHFRRVAPVILPMECPEEDEQKPSESSDVAKNIIEQEIPEKDHMPDPEKPENFDMLIVLKALAVVLFFYWLIIQMSE